MKKRRIAFGLLACLLLCVSCKGGSTEEPLPYVDEELVLPALQWSGGPLREDGTNSYWDARPLAEAGVNLVSVLYRPLGEDGVPLSGFWLPTAEQYRAAMEHAAPDIALSDSLGLRVMGYADTVQFDAQRMQDAYGYTLEDLAVKNADGSYAFSTAWDPAGNFLACINQPAWREMLTEINRLTAEAGFASLMYDYYPYAAAGYFCHCRACAEQWAAYSLRELGEEAPMPESFAFPDPVSIAYYKFRMESYASFMKETAAEAKKINPSYELLQNHNMNSGDLPSQMLLGGIQTPTSEFWGVANGDDSTLYMYQLAEALGAERLYTYYNAQDQWTPIYRYKVNLAESYAVCGGMMLQQEPTETAAGFFRFVQDHPRVYAGSRSIAQTGILYSWESALFSDCGADMSLGYLDYPSNLSRQAAAAMVKAGVPADFVALEREGALERMKQYSTLVIPEYDYFDAAVWREPLRAYVEDGGSLVVLGEKAGDFVREALESAAEGTVYWVDGFTRVYADADMVLPEEFLRALADAGADRQLRITSAEDSLSATVRRNGPDLYLHVIRRGDPAWMEEPEKGLSLTFTLPEGYTVRGVTAECPYMEEGDAPSVRWSLDEEGRLEATVDRFDTYLLITLSSVPAA